MKSKELFSFSAVLDLIGINPFVPVPAPILEAIFEQTQKDKGPIPVKGTVNQKPYLQTLIRYKGAWRLYINTLMLDRSPQRVGETLNITIAYNPTPPAFVPPPAFLKALKKDRVAAAVYQGLPPSLQKEINRYLSNLKTPVSLERNIQRALNFLKGTERFVGRDRPH